MNINDALRCLLSKTALEVPIEETKSPIPKQKII